jgi:hypothetical protein
MMRFATVDGTVTSFEDEIARHRLWCVEGIERPAVVFHAHRDAVALERQANPDLMFGFVVVRVGNDVRHDFIEREIQFENDLRRQPVCQSKGLDQLCCLSNLRQTIGACNGQRVAQC